MSDQPKWSDGREIRIDASPEEVWAAWAEPEHVRRWFSDDAHGRLEPGGELVHTFEGHGEHRYRVVEVEAPRRLILDGAMEAGPFRQEVVIRTAGGSTVLRLVHSGFGTADPGSETVQGIDSGWTMALALLKHYVERHFGRDKATLALFRPARFDYQALLEDHYLGADGLGAWLTDGGAGIPATGPVALRLRSGRTLTGRVLARTEHEVSVSWNEISGALELKAFGAGPDARFLGLRVVSWGAGASLDDDLTAEIHAAVERLAAVLGADRA
jgi:uncharacterized protein YndB with AHSA1/START domain